MSLRDRVLPIQTQPEHVQRASRWERSKRTAWLLLSTVLSFGVVLGMASALVAGLPMAAESRLGLTVAAVAMAAAFVVDQLLFAWGVERFGLVVPWQFREAENADEPAGEP